MRAGLDPSSLTLGIYSTGNPGEVRVRLMIPLAIIALIGCDEKRPKTKEEFAAEEMKKYEAEEAEKRRSMEGRSFLGDELNPGSITTVHLRKDCPVHQQNLKEEVVGGKPLYKERKVMLRSGRFVDDQGFFYDPTFCSTCVP